MQLRQLRERVFAKSARRYRNFMLTCYSMLTRTRATLHQVGVAMGVRGTEVAKAMGQESKRNYFTSSDPHRDIILTHICHKS